MSASRDPLPPPNIDGITDDWERARKARERANNPTPNTQLNPPTDADSDAAPPRRHDATRGSDQGNQPSPRTRRPAPKRRPAPRADDAVALTVRVDPDEANEVDQFILELRQETGLRLDKAEVIRETLRLAREHQGIRQTLIRRLKS